MGFTRRDFLKIAGVSSLLGYGYLHGSGVYAQSPNRHWRQGRALPMPTQEIYPTVFNNEIYVGGGFVPARESVFFGLSPSKAIYVFNPESNSWRQGVPLPEARHHLGMVSNEQYLYGIGGFVGVKGKAWQLQKSVHRMTPNGKEWIPGPDLPVVMGESVYASLNNSIHVIGGKTREISTGRGTDTTKHFKLVDDAHWEEAAPATVARNSAGAAVLDGRIFVIGGRASGNNAGNKQFSEVYDPTVDRWEKIRPLPVASAGLSAVAVKGKILVSGGEAFGPGGNWKTGKAFNQVWSYDPGTDQWQEVLAMPQARHGHGTVMLAGKVYVIGGASKVGPQETSASVMVLDEKVI